MRRVLVIVLVFSLISWVAVGCKEKTHEKEKEKEAEIPGEISQGENVEPQLRVYLANEDSVVTMDMEEYIQGVVAAEMDPDWPQDALAAQAIEARTFTLQKIEEQGTLPGRDAHASTNIEEFQAYNPSRINDNVREAVNSTRGMVAVYQGNFIRAWFHAYCGGITASAKAGLNYQGEDPSYCKPVENPCREYVDEEIEFWSKTFSKAQIRDAVISIANVDPGDFKSIEISEAENGRAITFKVGDVSIPAPELRLALGSTEMRSTWVEAPVITGNEVKFVGRGYGHGVGLCQWGAKGWAEEGRSAEEIVKGFFPDVNIQKLWD